MTAASVRSTSIAGRVLVYVALHPGCTIAEIGEGLQERTSTIRRALDRHRNRKLVSSRWTDGSPRDGYAVWSLVSAPRMPLPHRILEILSTQPTLTRAQMAARFPKERVGSISQALTSLEQRGAIVVLPNTRPLVFTLAPGVPHA